MELLILLLIGLLIVVFVAMAKASATKRDLADLTTRLLSVENELRSLRRPSVASAPATPVEAKTPVPPPLPVITPAPEKKSEPPPIPQRIAEPKTPKPAKPPIDWEQFMGAKLFAWIGGLALFLGVAFFVKYSFEHNLIPPQVRVAIGFVVGVVLLVGGVLLKRKENAVTAQTLCATGVLVLYAVTFACRSYYHFPFFGLIPTFLLMVLITAVAFLLAVRLTAIFVAVLGIAGGFLTPVLLSTGQDRPLGLFVYIALLDIGLLAVAQRQRWNVLPILAAIGTVLMQISWVLTFFIPEKYFAGNKVLIFMTVFGGFQGLFLAASAWAKRTGKMNHELGVCALGLAAIAMSSAFYLLSYQTIAQSPALLFSYLFVVDLGLLALTLIENRLAIVEALTGATAFIFLGAWTSNYLTAAQLYTALTFYFVFTLFHAVTPLVLRRLRKTQISWWSHGFPAFALLLVLMPIFQLTQVSVLVWPFVLLVDLVAIVLALMTGMLLPIIGVLLLTLVAIGASICRIPSDLTGLPTDLFLLGGFAIFFLVAATWATRRFRYANRGRAKSLRQDHRANESFNSASCAVCSSSVSVAHHGHGTVTARESFVGLRSRPPVRPLASRNDEDFIARCVAGGRARLSSGTGTRMAFPTFRSGAGNTAADVVSRILCGVQRISVRFPSEIFRKNRALGYSGARRTVAFLCGLSARSNRASERHSWSRPSGVRYAVSTGPFRFAEAHTARQSGAQRATRALRRRRAVLYHPDFPDPIRPTMDHG